MITRTIKLTIDKKNTKTSIKPTKFVVREIEPAAKAPVAEPTPPKHKVVKVLVPRGSFDSLPSADCKFNAQVPVIQVNINKRGEQVCVHLLVSCTKN